MKQKNHQPRRHFYRQLNTAICRLLWQMQKRRPFNICKRKEKLFFLQASCSVHNPTFATTVTDTSHRVKPQRFCYATFINIHFYLRKQIKPSTAHIHTNAPVSSCCREISTQSCAELGGQAAAPMASAVTHGLPECVRLPDVPLAFPVEHSPRTHSTSPHWAPSFQNTVPTAHKVLTSNPPLQAP